jgi:hypothetical protein
MSSQDDTLFDEITHVEEEISRFRSTTGNLQDYIPLLRLNPFSFGSRKAGEMRDRRDVYLTALNKGLEDRMEKGTHQPCIQANVILDEEAKLNSEELTSISLTMLSGGLDVSSSFCLDLHSANHYLTLRLLPHYFNGAWHCWHNGQTSNRRLGRRLKNYTRSMNRFVMHSMTRNAHTLLLSFASV